MRQYNIVLAVLEQDGKYLLQRRANHPKVGAAGLVGFFGGKIEIGEEPTETLCREVAEETTLQPKPEDLTSLGKVSVEMDHTEGTAKINAQAFGVDVPSNSDIKALEWELVILTDVEARKRVNELTPATKAVFQGIIWKE